MNAQLSAPTSARLRRACGAMALLLAGACSTTTQRAASVVDYLYPDRRNPRVDSTTTVLRLPVRVGIAFVPAGQTLNTLAEADQIALLDSVASRFRTQPFVQSIEIIPSAYLRARGGFENVDQLHRMFGIDVIALVSYDQLQFSDTQRSSITYWTIVGAYLVKAEKNETRTMLDAAVFDIASRKLLFRAPGVSTVKGTATAMNVAEEQRHDSQTGFRLAQQDLTPNLERQLEAFRARVRAGAAEGVRVERASPTGAGSVDGLLLLLAIAAAASGALARRRSV